MEGNLLSYLGTFDFWDAENYYNFLEMYGFNHMKASTSDTF